MTPLLPTQAEVLQQFHANGFAVGDACCIKCGHVFATAVQAGVSVTKLECPKCQAQCSLFYEFDPSSSTQPNQ